MQSKPLKGYFLQAMVNPQDVETVIRRMAEARDQVLRKVLYSQCQRCSQVKPIGEAVGVEFPPEDGGPRPEIWCKSCFTEMLLG